MPPIGKNRCAVVGYCVANNEKDRFPPSEQAGG